MENRKLFNKRDILFLLPLLILIIIFAAGRFFVNEENGCAVIRCGVKVIDTISLAKNGEYSYSELEGMVFSVKDGGIAVTQSDCHDKICVNTGRIYSGGETIVCLPHKAVVTVESGEKNNVDVVLG